MREAPFSLYDDWMEFEITLYGIRGNDDLHEISCIAEKDGKLYNICTVLDNEDSITASLRDYGFGRQIPEGSPAPADYLSPKYFKEEKETWLIRCIPIGLEDGNRVFIWLKYDLTEAIREHGNFLLRCVLLTIGVTLLASVITSLVMRRFALIPDAHGVVIGARKGVRYREQEIDLMPGAKIFLFTDGVTEARNAEGIMFGEARMVRALNEVREKSPNKILLHMKKTVDEFVQDAAQFDDQTMLCLEYRGPACYNDDPVRESF